MTPNLFATLEIKTLNGNNGTLHLFKPFIIYPLFLFSGIALGEQSLDPYKLSLKELMNVNVTSNVASNTERPILEQPSIISVITREQIINSGARDLLDILRMVPGFGFAHDTVGITSWGFRGIYAEEGKIMLLIDGAPFNDPAWGNMELGWHFPVELFAKVEIIRGPGAAKFGNYAELAVVKITTVGHELDGGLVDVNYRNMEGTFGSAELTGMYGKEIRKGLAYSIALNIKDTNRTTLPLSNPDGSDQTDQNYSPMNFLWLDAKLNIRNFTFSTLLEEYSFEHNESLAATPDPDTVVDQGYERLHVAASYTKKISDKLLVNGSILYQEVVAHDMVVTTGSVYALPHGSHYRIETERSIASADATYTLSENSSLNVGIEYVDTYAHSAAVGDYFSGDPSGDSRDTWFQGSDHLDFNQNSVFLQYENYTDFVNFTLGMRYIDNSASAETVTVPRIALSKKWGNFGSKLMYSEAFRTGDAEHINLATRRLEPETLDATEIEFHYLAKSGLYTINFFDMNLDNAITFNDEGSVSNGGGIFSTGYEASWLGNWENHEQELTVSHYKGDDKALKVQLAEDGESYLGFPTYKLTYRLAYKLSDSTKLTATASYENEKYRRTDIGDVLLDSSLLINVAVTHQFSNKLTLQASIHDVLNEGYYYPQAYGSGIYPGPEREISFSANYLWN